MRLVSVGAFQRDGAIHLPGSLEDSELTALRALALEGPGGRLRDAELPALIASATAAAQSLIGDAAFPVRAVLFDKTPEANWAVAWHQDRTIVVRKRCEVEGFGPWSRKNGLQHVAPPIAVLEGMVTLRIHLDACGGDNSPLKAALGSHRLGRVPASEAAKKAAEHPLLTCLAEPGDIWAYSTPILHASERARFPSRRRVLQIDYAADELPGGLQWAGVGAEPH